MENVLHTEYEQTHCPVCGFYCNGKGGVGCIDKPKLYGIEPVEDPKLSLINYNTAEDSQGNTYKLLSQELYDDFLMMREWYINNIHLKKDA